MHNSRLFSDVQYDALDAFTKGLMYEINRESLSHSLHTMLQLGAVVERHVLKALSHECQLEHSVLLAYCINHPQLSKWYLTTDNRYADFFMEQIPIEPPYIENPEGFACLWGNLASQMIGVIIGNIREEGLSG